MGRQRGKRLLYPAARFASRHRFVEALDGGIPRFECHDPVGDVSVPDAAAYMVYGAAVDQGEDPGRWLGKPGVVARRLPPDREKRFLHRVLGKPWVADDPQRNAVGDPPVAVIEGGKRVFVALGAGGDELLIGLRILSHTWVETRGVAVVTAYWVGVIDAETQQSLLQRLQAGDESAFRALVSEHTPSMTRVAMAFVSRRAIAEEVVQETWLNVVRSLGAFEGRSSLRTWIFTILGNCARRRAEQEQRFVPMSELASQEAAGDDIGVSSDHFFDGGRWDGMWSTVVRRWDDLPEQRALSGELRAAMLEAIDALPRMQRAVIALRDIEDWPAAEVCGFLGIMDGNQRILLHRARMTVRAAIERYIEAGRRPC